MNKVWYLSQINIFEGMNNEDMIEINLLDAINHFNWFPKNTLVQTPGKVREGLFFVKEGKLKLYMLNERGKKITLDILERGNLFGELNSFSLGTKRVYIETMESSLICSLSEDQFKKLMIHRPQLAQKLIKILSDRLKERDDQLEKLAIHGLRTRVLHLFCTLSVKFGVIREGDVLINLALPQEEIANMLCASQEAVSGVMNELVNDGIIKTSHMSVLLSKTMLENKFHE
ncbi:CRP/FNR family transcriptional regulator, anaerobic regulatory protein [Paenibacillus sp. UNC496MF]|uniref:Crp/Fnr family transcriptional regulator n=1 Tax=Paenibacillus sp. UNC496MF TaxID=1502753 RepID=UPI0008E1817E|nr:Crp/Fnr family transcriptional regulator [Paenibacillus sp. UNC496MF]SFJ30833.1 CRP/FNR family transcriptional regulator, anaerobic regulatory protein [Paenibacillus sp. UNC496MF]